MQSYTHPLLPSWQSICQSNHSSVDKIKTLLLGNLLLILSSYLTIPLIAIPITLQTLALGILVVTMGHRYTIAALSCYVIEGATGLPVFAGGSAGLAVLCGYSAGYFCGFFISTYVMGKMIEHTTNQNYLRCCIAFCIGSTLILLFGFCWLAQWVGFQTAFVSGVMPFIPIEMVKAVLLVLFLKYRLST